MIVVLCYDIKTDKEDGAKRLRQVAETCEQYGIRVQNSVFELDILPGDFEQLKIKLNKIIDKDSDSVRIYRLGKNVSNKITVLGNKNRIELGESLIF